jgi:hypothetical protein
VNVSGEEAPLNRLKRLFAFTVGFVALAGIGVMIAIPEPARSLPLYARQTGQPCATCHTAFPELTPYGRRFKLLGYTAGGTRCRDSALRSGGDSDRDMAALKGYLGVDKNAAADTSAAAGPSYMPPISFMVIPSYTHTAKSQDPSTLPPGVGPNDNWQLQTASIFAGGQVYCDFGAWVQVTHDPNASYSPFFLDNTDLRYAKQTNIFGWNAIVGLSVHNNPTVQDVWNTTPAWGFPQQSSEVAPTPVASTMIESAWGGRVVGTSAYMLLKDQLYAEFGYYRAMDSTTLQNLGQDPAGDRISGAAPYWRLAYEKNWDQHSLMFGTFGMMANIFPGNDRSQGTDQILDWGFDTQYQYIGDVHGLTTKVTYIKETQKRDASVALGAVDNEKDYLNKFKASATYHYEIPPLTGSRIAITGGYFSINGTADATQYGTLTGSPNSAGWIGELAWIPFNRGNITAWPWMNMRLGLQYTAYTKFDGASFNGDGDGRKASDNNTVYAYVWTAF